jgi:hypothetical protein
MPSTSSQSRTWRLKRLTNRERKLDENEPPKPKADQRVAVIAFD